MGFHSDMGLEGWRGERGQEEMNTHGDRKKTWTRDRENQQDG